MLHSKGLFLTELIISVEALKIGEGGRDPQDDPERSVDILKGSPGGSAIMGKRESVREGGSVQDEGKQKGRECDGVLSDSLIF